MTSAINVTVVGLITTANSSDVAASIVEVVMAAIEGVVGVAGVVMDVVASGVIAVTVVMLSEESMFDTKVNTCTSPVDAGDSSDISVSVCLKKKR